MHFLIGRLGGTSDADEHLGGAMLISSVCNLAYGSDLSGRARKAACVEAGIVDASISLMRAVPRAASLQEQALRFFASLISLIRADSDSASELAIVEAMLNGGGIQLAVASVTRFPSLYESGGEFQGARRFFQACAGVRHRGIKPFVLAALQAGAKPEWLSLR